jgi:aspartate/methionine/tyrosine aminotransferase
LEQIAGVCREHDLLCISDEVYDRLVYRDQYNPEAEHISIASLPGMADRTITLNSIGKTYSLTGWKIGWAVASPELTRGVRAAHQYLTYAVNTPMQHAAAEALGAPGSYYSELTAMFASRRDALAEALERLGFKVNRPAGGYFILADHRAVSEPLGLTTDVEVCHHLIEHAGVATIPPTAFYDHKHRGEHLLRFAFCKTQKTIDAAVERLRTLAQAVS